MFRRLRQKLSPRMLAVYIVVTIFGTLVLILASVLLVLLYWMNAVVPLPPPDRMVLPQATDFVAVMLRDVPNDAEGVADFLCEGATPQVRNLVAKGLNDPKCPLLIVASRLPGDEIPLTLSMGAYPGQFSLVRRDLQRRLKRQTLDGSMTYHLGKTIFQVPASGNAYDTLCLSGCTVLRTEDMGTMRLLIERMASKETAVAVPGAPLWPADSTAVIAAVGRFNGWRPELLERLPNAQWARDLREVIAQAADTAPTLTSCKSLTFQSEQWADGRVRVEVEVVAASPEDAKEIVSAVGTLLDGKKVELGNGIHEVKTKASDDTVSFTVMIEGGG